MADAVQVAKQFVDFYYATFDTDRKNLAALYVGSTPILNVEKLTFYSATPPC
jgi:hypothetical protein